MKWPFSETKNKTAPAATLPHRVLLVENDEDLQNVYVSRLQAEGIEVVAVPTGAGLVDKVINYNPGLMILDVMLSDMNGLDALEEIRKNPQTANLKVVVVSAVGTEPEQTRAQQLKVLEYLVKSQLVLDDMIEHIKRHLGMITATEGKGNPYGV